MTRMTKGLDELVLNKSGQALGQKGFETRNRILEATETLLAGSRGVAPSVAALARAAGISSPTFYLYFEDVGEAILAVVEQLSERLDPVLELLNRDWSREELFEKSHAFVQSYFNYWYANAPGLRARNRLADQGDQRFVALRVVATRKLTDGLAAKLRNPPVIGGLPCTPFSMAAGLMTALERLATVLVLQLYPEEEQDIDERINSLANLVALTVRG